MRELDRGDRSATTGVRDNEAIRRGVVTRAHAKLRCALPAEAAAYHGRCYHRPMRKVVYALVGAAIAGGIVWSYVSSTDWYTLWRDRRDPDANTTKLCETRGRSALPAIYRAFDEHGSDTDVGKFRVAIVDELRCIRGKDGDEVPADNEKLDLPEDRQLAETIVRAWNQEPDAKLRENMITFMSELDARAYFAIWAGIQAGPHPADGRLFLPSVRDVSPALREAWCNVVRPVVVDELDGDKLEINEFERSDLAAELGRAHCSDDAARLQRAWRAHRLDATRLGALAGLVALTVPPERASQTIVPLIGDCDAAMQLQVELEHKLDATAAAIVASELAKCHMVCDDPATCAKLIADYLTKQ